MILSVIIPTYNRGTRLLSTLRHLLANNTEGFEEVEVIVVDDGSETPVSDFIATTEAPHPFTLTCVRQENRGAGPARNSGFRIARGDILLFMDDDIIPPSDFLQRHVDAHHERPRSVIVGLIPVMPPPRPTPLYRLVTEIQGEFAETDGAFVPWLLASGNASFEASMFTGWRALYTELPGGDDAEITSRFRRLGIPIWLAPSIRAPQDQPVTLRAQVQRAYHHAVGIGIVASRNAEDDDFRRIVEANGPTQKGDSPGRRLKKAVLPIFSPTTIRSALLRVAEILDRDFVPDMWRIAMYRALLNLNYFAGIRRGMIWRGEAIPGDFPKATALGVQDADP